jgi:hypothetical protein
MSCNLRLLYISHRKLRLFANSQLLNNKDARGNDAKI